MEENKRLSDLTRMLLSSPSFSNFLDHLSTNPAAPQPTQQIEQRQPEQAQMPKDVSPYATAQAQQQRIGMVMMPEQTMDFSMLNLESNGNFNYQPRVFTVLDTPELPEMDTAFLTGKSSDVSESFESSNDKIEIPVLEAPTLLESAKAQSPESSVEVAKGEKACADLDADIFDDENSQAVKMTKIVDGLCSIDINALAPKAHYELVDASEEGNASTRALKRVQRLTAGLEATMARLERLTSDL
jgi:hypothetical protein